MSLSESDLSISSSEDEDRRPRALAYEMRVNPFEFYNDSGFCVHLWLLPMI